MPAALQEVHRVLRPSGEARILVYKRNSFHYWLNQVLLEGIFNRGLVTERSMAGVLSRGVERSSVGARPLVRVYSQRQVRRLMSQAGFDRVETSIRHFQAHDAFPAALLENRVGALRDPVFLDRLGRIGGWYVVARGRRP
jgi:ubiquinone/menaquinone biosynthesis C-methylase UbiE